MAKKTKVYVDTSAFIAFLDRSDSYHDLFTRLFTETPVLITSSFVVAEGHGWFLKRYDAYRALQFLDFLEELTPLSVLPIGQAEIKSGHQILKKFPDQSLTLADAIGLFIMKQHKIKTCWSTDRHLGIAGAQLIIHVH